MDDRVPLVFFYYIKEKSKIYGTIDFKTDNLIYGMRCDESEKMLCVRQTGGSLNQRILLNRSLMTMSQDIFTQGSRKLFDSYGDLWRRYI